MLSKSEAKRIASRWVDQRHDLPDGAMLMSRSTLPSREARLFDIMFLVRFPNSKKEHNYQLMRFIVNNDGSIEILKDRQSVIRFLLRDIAYEVVRK